MTDPSFVRVQIDDDGYLYVETRTSTIDPQEVLSVFLETLDPATIADQVITNFPDLDPVAGTIAVLRRIVDGGD